MLRNGRRTAHHRRADRLWRHAHHRPASTPVTHIHRRQSVREPTHVRSSRHRSRRHRIRVNYHRWLSLRRHRHPSYQRHGRSSIVLPCWVIVSRQGLLSDRHALILDVQREGREWRVVGHITCRGHGSYRIVRGPNEKRRPWTGWTGPSCRYPVLDRQTPFSSDSQNSSP